MPHTPFDPQNYLHHLEGIGLTEGEKIEFIRMLWLIAQSFVDDAYSARTDVDVSQLKSGFEAANVIDLGIVKNTRAIAANDNAGSRAKREPRARRKEA
ncbi:MAG: hypothetical protein SH859_07475 [Hyphomicrobium aestuarii]|nr:hypothetical protein [Hyphomicrobium aestuarii]